MTVDEQRLRAIVRDVVAELAGRGGAGFHGPPSAAGRMGIFADVDGAVAAARDAFEQYKRCGKDVRARAVANLRALMLRKVATYAEMTVRETGLGRIDHKIKKNTCVAERTPGVEVLEPAAFTGDDGLTLTEWAPFGVIGAITPTTNVTETLLNNGISMIAGGNAVVFNVHPSAKGISAEFIRDANEAIVAAGAPENLLCSIAEPTIESANGVMNHPGIRLVVVTGGPGVVNAAMQTGKRAICAGPGNPPVVVDDTADLRQAGRDVVLGAGMDNNIVCIVEKEVIAHERIADELQAEMERAGGFRVRGADVDRLVRHVLADDTHVKKEYVGKDAAHILREAGINVSGDPAIAFFEVDDGRHPLVQIEQLMPIIPLFRVRSTEAAIAAAVEAEKGNRHTAVMHSKNIDALHAMAVACDASIFVKNGPSYNGVGFQGEGYTAWTIAGTTGEGLTTAQTFVRMRRCVLKDHFRIV